MKKIAIIGGGPIGIYLSTLLVESNLEIHLFESGKIERESNLLGRHSYRFLKPSKMPEQVHRLFGGANYWKSRIGEFLEDDFRSETLNHEDIWTITKKDLQAGYSDALQFLNKRLASDFDIENEFRLQIKEIAPFPELALRIHKFAETEVWHNSLKNLILKQNFNLRLDTFVAEILPASELKKTTLTLISNHQQMDEEFDFIVVTAGTFQSTALLLRSEKLQIPNRSILGSGLMDHIEGVVGHIAVYSRNKKEFFRKVVLDNKFCFTGKNYGGGFFLRGGSITYHVEFVPLQHNFIPPGTRLIFTKFRNFRSKIRIYLEKKVLRADHYSLNLKAEEFMNADSKVYLDEAREKLIVDHKISTHTLQAIRLELVKFRNYLEENRIGKCFLDAQVYRHLKNSGLNPNWHPMGTTRLGRHEAGSILDYNLALHRHKDIFVASASVFPTGSDGNPTFTTMALTFRLSKHLLTLAG